MPLPQILGELGALATRGLGLGRMKPNGATPPFIGGNPGKLAQPTVSPGTQLPSVPSPDSTDDTSDSQDQGSGIGSNPPISPTLRRPPMTEGMQQRETLLDNPPTPVGGVRGKVGGFFNAIGWDWAGNPLKYPAHVDPKTGQQVPSLADWQANLARANAKAQIEDEALKRQESQQRINESAENQRYLRDLRQQNMDLSKQKAYEGRMENIEKAGGFEAPNVPPEIQSRDIPMSPQLTQIPSGSGPYDPPSNTDIVNNLPQKSPLLIPGMTPQQSSNLGTVESLKDPSTGEVRNMVRPNLKTQAEMKQVDAPQDILDFYKNLPADFTKQYPVTPPTVPASGKISPEEAKRLETKYQRDSAALQAWNTQKGKPASSAQNKEQFQSTMAKIAAAGLPAGAITNVNQQVSAIRSAAQRGVISPDEANSAIGYLAANTTPAAQGSNTTIRVEGMANMRMSQVLDTKNGNAPVLMNANEINEANRLEPGRFIPAGPGTQALNKTALLEDIRGSINQTRESLAKVPEFSMADKAKIAVAMRDRDPRSAVAQLIGGAAGSSMTPDQQEYLINLAQLHEQAMAMRSVLGAGQSSEDLRAAIMRTIPGPGTPNKAYAAKQLDAFEKTINRLGRGVPQVPLRGGGTQQNQPQTFDVTDPLGTVHHFPSQQAADAFKKAAGLQ